jgi:hypothetical protein
MLGWTGREATQQHQDPEQCHVNKTRNEVRNPTNRLAQINLLPQEEKRVHQSERRLQEVQAND